MNSYLVELRLHGIRIIFCVSYQRLSLIIQHGI